MTEDIKNENSLLQQLESPSQIMQMTQGELETLAEELRRHIIDTVSVTGGHLAPSLGVIELTLAMFNVFDLDKDKVIWDVGHQAYAHKILTGRRDNFNTLRTLGGISGFPKRSESKYDHFGVGHSSTSISAALGMAMAHDLEANDGRVLAVIGDGSMTAGMAFEGLNQAGHHGRDLVVVLNDNEMSISKNVGALSSFLSRNLSARWVRRMKKDIESIVGSIPSIGEELMNYVRKSENSLKGFFTPGMLFEAFQFNYVGPIDGHNLPALTNALRLVKGIEGPVLLHVLTKKGKGYEPAEDNPSYFHGVGCFEPETGQATKVASSCALPSYTDVFGQTLCDLAAKDTRIIAITAAMPEGTGTSAFAERFPERFVDVGICEQHAVTFAAGLATEGYKPVVAIYSTFMQRSYDQVVHDVCLQNLPVTLCLDRGGLVGEDGPTHHGAFDLSYLRHVPNLVLMAPKDEAELQRLLATAMAHDGPVAIRYPRGVGVGADLIADPQPLPIGVGELVRDGADALVIGVGSRVLPSLDAIEELERDTGRTVALFNARFVKPLPEAQIMELAQRFDRILLVEENARMGGFSSAVLELLADSDLMDGKRVRRLGLPDEFVEHGKQVELRRKLGIDRNGIRDALRALLGVDKS